MNAPRIGLDPPIIGSSPATRSLVRLIARIRHADVGVLITGESGTGKELVARNLHNTGPRHRGPFVAINCAALNAGVLESELFGHGRGAFTGAVASHVGLFEQADGGTLFLDEIGEVPPETQAKLLRVLQDGEVRPMGTTRTRVVDVRVIAATNVDIEQRVGDGEFRLDLFYRINVLRVALQPLRERAADVLDLIRHAFMLRLLEPPEIAAEAEQVLLRYDWPGNVREVFNEADRLVALYPRMKRIDESMLSEHIRREPGSQSFDLRLLYDSPLPRAVGYLEENLLRKTLVQTNWNKSASARILGLSRQGLLKKIKRYGLPMQAPPADEEASGAE
jgi:two-component system response regulator HupR/HoxA